MQYTQNAKQFNDQAQISKIITNRKKQHINTVSAVSIWLLICTSLLKHAAFGHHQPVKFGVLLN